jgi:hypothetical protein
MAVTARLGCCLVQKRRQPKLTVDTAMCTSPTMCLPLLPLSADREDVAGGVASPGPRRRLTQVAPGDLVPSAAAAVVVPAPLPTASSAAAEELLFVGDSDAENRAVESTEGAGGKSRARRSKTARSSKSTRGKGAKRRCVALCCYCRCCRRCPPLPHHHNHNHHHDHLLAALIDTVSCGAAAKVCQLTKSRTPRSSPSPSSRMYVSRSSVARYCSRVLPAAVCCLQSCVACSRVLPAAVCCLQPCVACSRVLPAAVCCLQPCVACSRALSAAVYCLTSVAASSLCQGVPLKSKRSSRKETSAHSIDALDCSENAAGRATRSRSRRVVA